MSQFFATTQVNVVAWSLQIKEINKNSQCMCCMLCDTHINWLIMPAHIH